MAGIIRVARDNSAVIVKVGDTYNRVSADLSNIEKATELATLLEGSEWRRPLTTDVVTYREHSTLAAGNVLETQVEASEPAPERQIRMPKAVQRALAENAEALSTDPQTIQYITEMASSTTTTASKVTWLRDTLMNAHTTYTSMGGDAAYNWFVKFDTAGGIQAAGEPFSASEHLEYYGISDEEGAQKVSGLIAVNRIDDIVLTWTADGFIPEAASVSDFEAGTIVELDPETATALAGWVNEGGKNEEGFDILANDAAENNLIEMALAESGVWSFIDDVADAIVAAGPDPALYTPQERSQNAQRQQRQTGGKFGGPQVGGPEAAPEEDLTAYVKATLPAPLPLLQDPAARIAEYLGGVGGDIPAPEAEQPIIAAATPDASAVAPLYLAVVDPVDNTAVLEIAAILPDGAGNASAWVRNEGQWVPNNDLVADLQGATPPPVVELDDEGTIKDILAQADSSDNNEEVPEAPAPEPSTAPVLASASLFGDYGEILPPGVVIAAGVPGISDTASDKAATERLMRYWAYGPGAVKIRWGTEGDLTRAHRYLSKYVGPKRAWGLAQNLHKRVMGMDNATHDRITGQTK